MQSERQPLKPHLLALVAAGLEAAAAPFAPDALKAKLLDAAKLGVAEVRISPALALDVRKTKTAAKGVAYLERENIACDWQAAAALPDAANNPGGLPGEFYVLVVRLKA